MQNMNCYLSNEQQQKKMTSAEDQYRRSLALFQLASKDHNKALNYTRFTLLCCTTSRHKELDVCPYVIVQWSNDNDTRMDILSHCCVSVI